MGEKVEDFEGQILAFTTKRLAKVGLWPCGRESKLCQTRALLVAANVYAAAILLTSVYLEELPSASALIENTSHILTIVPCCVAVVRLRSCCPAFRAVVSSMRSTMAPQDELVRSAVAEEKRTAQVYTLVTCATGVCLFASPLVDLATGRRAASLPLKTWPLVDLATGRRAASLPLKTWPLTPGATPAHFAAEYVIQLVIVSTFLVTMSVIDSFVFALVKYSALQLRLFGASLLALGRVSRRPCDVGETQVSSEQRLTEYVKRHQEILTNMRNLADLLSPLFFMHYIVSSAVICLVGFRMFGAKELRSIVTNLGQLICIVYRLFLLSYFSSEVTSQSVAVGEAAYKCNWYRLDKKGKRMLALMMCRAQRPVVMRTGMFGVLSLETFGGLVQRAYSYYTLLKKLSNT